MILIKKNNQYDNIYKKKNPCKLVFSLHSEIGQFSSHGKFIGMKTNSWLIKSSKH